MKKSLFLLCLIGSSCVLSAQEVSNFAASNAKSMTTVPVETFEMVNRSAGRSVAAPAEFNKLNDESEVSHDGSALYRAPYGTLYSTLTPDWMARKGTQLYVPAQTELTFENYCKIDKKSVGAENVGWTMDGSDGTQNLDSLMDEDGNLVKRFFGYYYVPEVSVYAPEDEQHADALDSYWTYREDEEPADISWMIAGTDTVECLGYACVAAGQYGGFADGGEFTTNKNFLVLDKGDDGKVGWKDTGKKCVGFGQYIEAPEDMLYITSVYMNLWNDGTSTEGFRLEGKELTAEIYRVTEEGLSEVVATATACEDDVYYESEYELATISFVFVEDDPIFGEMDAPVVLDGSSDYMVVISGFGQLTSEWTCGFCGADGFQGHGYAILEDGSIATIGYSNALTTPQVDLYLSLEAAMPVASVVGGFEDITVRIPEEGGYGVTVYDEEEQKWYNDFEIYTLNTSEWWEEVDAPGWVDIEFDDTYVDEYGVLMVFVAADALPKGVEERHGEVILSLYGKDITIPVAQGELPDAVRNRLADSQKKIYFNLHGQQEFTPAKGKIYIVDGQKVMF